jgi:hypothetical protein
MIVLRLNRDYIVDEGNLRLHYYNNTLNIPSNAT